MALIHVVMGVCGCGKSTVGRELAASRGVPYLEGDEFHPPENVAKMTAGIALTDDDRAAWLDRLRRRLAQAVAADQGLVLGCSALKRGYRDTLRAGAPALVLVFLHGSRELLAARMAARRDHYMPPSLLGSQLAILQPPQADEAALAFDVQRSPQAIVADIVADRRTRDG